MNHHALAIRQKRERDRNALNEDMHSSKSYWHLSKTLATQTGMTNDWLRGQGLTCLLIGRSVSVRFG